ncbi:uncharacterized protein LOC113146457 [Cyclospora cayetanensis]|uniref:Uncharacterized protein LOC113146457 n=1 Tax=Cyclospora cayetanensis TaxID=88456 RepID=A0A6P6RPX4_9EIME|nr:uncharacterized protein LOC113146457 [Cyclospora cayetanensis]
MQHSPERPRVRVCAAAESSLTAVSNAEAAGAASLAPPPPPPPPVGEPPSAAEEAAAEPQADSPSPALLWWLLGGFHQVEPHNRLLILSLLLAVAAYVQVAANVQCGFRMRKVALRAKNALLAAVFHAALRRPYALLPCYGSGDGRKGRSDGEGQNDVPAASQGALVISVPPEGRLDMQADVHAASEAGLVDTTEQMASQLDAEGQPLGAVEAWSHPQTAAWRGSHSSPVFAASPEAVSEKRSQRLTRSHSTSDSSKHSSGGGGALTRAVSFGGNLHRVVSQTLFDGAAAAVLTAAATAETAAAVAAEAVAAAAEHDAANSSGGESYLSAVSEGDADEEEAAYAEGFASPRQLLFSDCNPRGSDWPQGTALPLESSLETPQQAEPRGSLYRVATQHVLGLGEGGMQEGGESAACSAGAAAGAGPKQPPGGLVAAADRSAPLPKPRQRVGAVSAATTRCLRSSSGGNSASSSSAGAAALELANLVSVDCERTQVGICVLHELWAAPLTLALNLLLVYRQIPGAFLYAVAVTGAYYLHAIGNCLFVSTPLVVKLAALTCLVARGEGGGSMAKASTLFAALALIDKALQALNSLPTLMGDLTAAAVALKRLGRCLSPPSGALQPQLPPHDQHAHQRQPQRNCREAPYDGKAVHVSETPGTCSESAVSGGGADAGSAVICFRDAAFAWRPLRPHELLASSDSCISPSAAPPVESPQTASSTSHCSSSSNRSTTHCNSVLSGSGSRLLQHGSAAQERPWHASASGEGESLYSLRSSSAVLHDVQLYIHPGELHVVVGKSGSGKSSLLAAILGDMNLVGGEAYLNLPRPSSCSANLTSSRAAQDSLLSSKEAALLHSGEAANAAAAAALANTASWNCDGRAPDCLDPWELIGYSPQQPVIFEGTLQSNILMGRPLVRSAYERVLRACSLETDIAALGGDATPIDAGGHRLSGGQRARICLARAIYSAAAVSACGVAFPRSSKPKEESNVDLESGETRSLEVSENMLQEKQLVRLAALGPRALYLIDDPFSALDAVTAMAVWRRVFASGGILSGRTVLLVMQQAALIMAKSPCVDGFVLLDGGRHAGSFVCARSDSASLFLEEEECNDGATCSNGSAAEPTSRYTPTSKSDDSGAWKVDVNTPASGPEATRTGEVAWRVWRLYMRSAGVHMVLLLLIACAVRF